MPFERIEEYEREAASNSYLMSIIFIVTAMGLPVFNLVATVIFYFANRKKSTFIRWHCIQAMLSQLSLFFINSAFTTWLILILLNVVELNNWFIGYALTILLFNLLEFIYTIHAAVQTRKGIHVRWLYYARLTDQMLEI